MKRTIFVLLGTLFVLAAPAFGQVVSQGMPGVTSDARAWPFKIVFGGAQIDPRDTSDRAGRLLGKITFDGAQPVTQSGAWSISFTAPQAVTQSGAWAVSFTAPQHTICDSGCGSPPSIADSQPFTFGTTSVGIIGAVVDDVGTNTVAENSYGAPRMTTNRELLVKCNVGCAAGGASASGANSSTTPLIAGATFTGTYEDLSSYAGVRVMTFADVSGTLFLDWSSDGVNLDLEDSYSVIASASVASTAVVAGIKAKFVRVKYTNNGVFAQAAFRLATAYMPNQTPDLLGSLAAPLGVAGAAPNWINRAFVMGGQNLNGSGVSSAKYNSFAWSDLAMTDGGYNVQVVRAHAAEGDGALGRLYGAGGGNPTGLFAAGGIVATAPSALVDTQMGTARITPYRALMSNLQDAAGHEIASATTAPGASDRGLVVRNLPSGTQAISAAALPLPSLAATSTIQSNGSQKTMIVDGFNAVVGSTSNALDVNVKSGSVTANAGTNLNTSALALEATQTNRSAKGQLTDGARDGTIKAASTAAVAADTALVVAMSPNSPSVDRWATVTLPTANWNDTTVINTTLQWSVDGYGTTAVMLRMNGIAGAGVTFESSLNGGTTWFAISGRTTQSASTFESGSVTALVFGYSKIWTFDVGGALTTFRARLSTVISAASGGTVDVIPINAATPRTNALVSASKGTTVEAPVTSTAEGADHQALDMQLYAGGVAVSPALETGGNLASVKTNTDKLDIALSALRDALAGASPNTKTLQDLYTLIGSALITPGTPIAPGTAAVVQVSTARALPLPLCNPVRRTNCSPKGF